MSRVWVWFSLPQASRVKLHPPNFVEVLTPAGQNVTDLEMGFKEAIELDEVRSARVPRGRGDEDADTHKGDRHVGTRERVPTARPREKRRGDLPAPSSTLDFQPPDHER